MIEPYQRVRTALRRELRRKRLRDGIWNDLVHWGQVDQVLRGSLTIKDLAQRYLIKEEDYFPQRSRRTPRELPSDKRAQALAQIVAVRIEWGLPVMALFRERHLDGRYLTFEEMAAWIRSQGAAEGPPTTASLAVPVASYGDFPAGTREERRAWHLAWLRRETERVTADPDCELPPSRVGFPQSLSFFGPARRLERLEIRGDGVLAWLKQIAETIVGSEHPGWNEAEAVLFILTGDIPAVPLGRVAYATAVVPAASHITMEISPRLSPREVAALYGEMRDRILLGRDKPFADRHLALAVFVERTRSSRQSWVELRRQWNEGCQELHPEWRYEPAADPEARGFALEARTAWRRITGSTWSDRRRGRRQRGQGASL